jgi:hypothetical protein
VSSFNSSSHLQGRKNHICRFDSEGEDKMPITEEDSEDDSEPLNFILKNSKLASVKNSFAYISSFINLDEFD